MLNLMVAKSADKTSSNVESFANSKAMSLAKDVGRAFSSPEPLLAAIEALKSAVSNSSWCVAKFHELEVLQSSLLEQYTSTAAQAATYLNRYVDVLPYDYNRVALGAGMEGKTAGSAVPRTQQCCMDVQAMPAGLNRPNSFGKVHSAVKHGDPSACTDYINASMLVNPNKDDPVPWKYVAAQGPLPHTCAAFWRMVVEQGAVAIVMLTEFVEGRRRKCDAYFAEEQGAFVCFDAVRVKTRVLDDRFNGVVLRELEVTGVPGAPLSLPWRVQHIHMIDWPDHGVPRSPATMLELCAQTQQYSQGESYAPVVVHCSAGIGRSGVFCAVDAATKQLKAAGTLPLESAKIAACNAVDVVRLVTEMRHQRAGMVQTVEQFRFCYVTLLELAQSALEYFMQTQEAPQ
jgi:protein tyrosine phosphatase